MGGVEERVVAVIMVGGPTKGTRFRPLSLNIPKPLFPLAGQPMVNHPISACKRREFALFVSSISNELRVPVRYLREDRPHGSAGGLYNFRDLIMEDNPSHIVLLNCDVCCSFPLPDMLEAHRSYGGIGTILVIKVSPESANQFGEIVADPVTNELLHYTEKPETFVSDRINCGVYIFTPDIFTAIQGVSTQRKDRATLRRITSFEALQPGHRSLPSDFVRLDQDILSPLAGKRQLYVYETMDFWEQIKTPGSGSAHPSLGEWRRHKEGYNHRQCLYSSVQKVHPTAKIGPSVSISANARIGAGSRLVNCIVLDDVEIKENAVVIHAIIGWKSSIGRWSRVQASGDHNAKLGITILGESVTVEDEVVVINSIILPNKTLNKMSSKETCRTELRAAVRHLSDRGLYSASKWAAEQLLGIEQDPSKHTPSHTRFQRGSSSIRRRFRTAGAAESSATPSGGVSYVSTPSMVGPEEYDYDPIDSDFYLLAKSYFDCREYRRAAHVLRDQTGKKAVFLRCYALYLAGEKRKEEEMIELEGPLGKSDAVNRELVSLERELSTLRKNGTIDPFGLYIYGLVLKEKGNENLARSVLVESVNIYPWNWSAWSELQTLCTTIEALNSLNINNHWMKDFFLASAYQELRMHNESLAKYEYLQGTFTFSNYIQAQIAKAQYNLREFEQVEVIFEELLRNDPYRMRTWICILMSSMPRSAFPP
ncbi:Anaphase-promoting complex subunit [Sesamum angolense]|uniref:Anaphase-promoting complex subunit n=1 Tax=Sesamum angolense TaxID=2727404 RepID=A0AAE1WZV3_9LAMI|nr:Anaphase-promoting complex subunit [Sesamum angolense]